MDGNHKAGLTSEDLDTLITGFRPEPGAAQPVSSSSDQVFLKKLINTARSADPDARFMADLDARIQHRLRRSADSSVPRRQAISRAVIRSLAPSRQLTLAFATIALFSAFIILSMSGWASAGQRAQLSISPLLIGEQRPDILAADALVPSDPTVTGVANPAIHDPQPGNQLTRVALSVVKAPMPPTTPSPTTRPTRVDTFTAVPVGP